jgi:hypothetical protein
MPWRCAGTWNQTLHSGVTEATFATQIAVRVKA